MSVEERVAEFIHRITRVGNLTEKIERLELFARMVEKLMNQNSPEQLKRIFKQMQEEMGEL